MKSRPDDAVSPGKSESISPLSGGEVEPFSVLRVLCIAVPLIAAAAVVLQFTDA